MVTTEQVQTQLKPATEGDEAPEGATPAVVEPEAGEAPGDEKRDAAGELVKAATPAPKPAAKPVAEEKPEWTREKATLNRTITRLTDQLRASDERWAKVDELADDVKALHALLRDGFKDPSLTETPELAVAQKEIAASRAQRTRMAAEQQAVASQAAIVEKQEALWPAMEKALRDKGYESNEKGEWPDVPDSFGRFWNVDPEHVAEMVDLLPDKSPDGARAKRIAGLASSPTPTGGGGGHRPRSLAEAADLVNKGTWTLDRYADWKEKNPNAPIG